LTPLSDGIWAEFAALTLVAVVAKVEAVDPFNQRENVKRVIGKHSSTSQIIEFPFIGVVGAISFFHRVLIDEPC